MFTAIALDVRLAPETQAALRDLRGLGRLPDALDRLTAAAAELVGLGQLALVVLVALFILWLVFGRKG